MHILLGGTGRIGSATATALLARGEKVVVVTRDGGRADALKRRGATVAVADVGDVAALRRVLQRGKRAFLLNPPADPAGDTDADERRTGAAIVAALEGSGLERVVLLSTYGAHAGERRGDLSTLYELEQAVRAQSIAATIVRAAYFMSNWDFALDAVRAEGVLHTLFPTGFRLPMVAPQDVGQRVAQLLVEAEPRDALQHVEGPESYSPEDVAAAFQATLGRAVRTISIPPEQWQATFEGMGFSRPAAESYARMTEHTLNEPYTPANAPVRGKTSLRQYVAALG